MDNEYWNERYRENRMGWNVGKVSRPLKVYFDGLANKDLDILIPGAGNAYEAEYLHRNGFQNVTVLDWAEYALEGFLKRVPDFPAEYLLCEDFFTHQGTYDLVIEQTFFCAIDPSLRTAYARAMHNMLAPGGELAGVLFAGAMFDDHPPFGGSDAEYRAIFEPLFQIKTLEPCYNSIPEREGNELFIRLIKPHPSLN